MWTPNAHAGLNSLNEPMKVYQFLYCYDTFESAHRTKAATPHYPMKYGLFYFLAWISKLFFVYIVYTLYIYTNKTKTL